MEKKYVTDEDGNVVLNEGDKCRCGKGQWPRRGKSGPEEEKVLDRINHFPYTGFIMQVNK